MSGTSTATPVAHAPATSEMAADAASIKVEGGVVKFFFVIGKADVATGATAALADVVKGVADGKRAVVSGYTDATGDAAMNAELAQQRAFAVRDALKAAGVPEDKVELKKPEQATGSGPDAEARRVEVTLQ
jgi:outer membrane protein OmpA-like peptidoglycan-associated protein